MFKKIYVTFLLKIEIKLCNIFTDKSHNKFVYVKFLEYYRNLYYNKDEKLDKSCLWLVLFTSKSFLELYNILGKLFDNDKREQFIRNVIDMIDDRKIFEDWELEKLNDFVKYKSEKNLKEEAIKEGKKLGIKEGIQQGIEQGIEQGIAEGEKRLKATVEEHIKNMFKENMDIELISKITNKTKEEILEIKKSLGL